MELKLDSPVQFVPRIGPRMAGLMRKLGIDTLYDLLTYVPFRYNDYSLVSPASRVQPGETVTVIGTLELIRAFVTKNGKRLVTARIRDESGSVEVIWFNQSYLVKVLHPGDQISASGKVDWFSKKIVLFSPEYEVLHAAGDGEHSLHTGRLVPVYPETEGMTSKWLRGRIAYALESSLDMVVDRLPEEIRSAEHLLGLRDAIRTIHFPQSLDDAANARERLAFDELFTLVLKSHHQKHMWKTTQTSKPLPLSDKQKDTFMSRLPFSLTRDQERAVGEILTDIGSGIPMNRMLEGDVGSGKTVVAAAGIYAAWVNGESSALLAPTQILSEQHVKTLRAILEAPHGIPVHSVLGGKTKQDSYATPAVFVGTHALLEPTFPMPRLGLIIIDEQQRFGVTQRAALRKQTRNKHVPHQLVMTATPIPRTIAQTVFGSLDVSVLAMLPSGRIPVKTWVVPTAKREAAYAWIAKELTQHRTRAFIICPFIEDSESLKTVKAVKSEYVRIVGTFPGHHVGLLHGKMKPAEKSFALERLHDGTDDILVATPVVEVGIDIPDATVIVIEAAERFGLSQLHQLRGRVGRSDKQSYCLLFTEIEQPQVLTRLKALETVHNGPELAELDLALRGPGELFGTRQHGLPGFTLARLTDTELLDRVRHAVSVLTDADPSLTKFPHLSEIVRESTIDTIQS